MSGNLHLLILPILLPLAAGRAADLIANRAVTCAMVGVGATLAGLATAVALLSAVDAAGGHGVINVYLTSNWAAPFGSPWSRTPFRPDARPGGIVTWDPRCTPLQDGRKRIPLHPLFQILLMGINGAS